MLHSRDQNRGDVNVVDSETSSNLIIDVSMVDESEVLLTLLNMATMQHGRL
jgi:hypothetical protein